MFPFDEPEEEQDNTDLKVEDQFKKLQCKRLARHYLANEVRKTDKD